MKRKIFSVGILLSLTALLFAQKGVEDGSKFGQGEDETRCRTNLSLFTEYAKQKNYKDAEAGWLVCYNECPAASKNIYIYGERILKSKIKTAKTKEDKLAAVDMLMGLYDQRIKYYGTDAKNPEAAILGKKGVDLYQYKSSDNSAVKEAYGYLKASIEGMGTKSKSSVIQRYMIVALKLYQKDELSGEDFISGYENIQNLLDQLIELNPAAASDYKAIKDNFEGSFAASGAADCETLSGMFDKNLAGNETNKEFLSKTVRLFKKVECDDSEAFYKASELLHAVEPSSESAYGIAKMYLKNGDIDKALEYYTEAVEMESDNETKASYYYQIAGIYFSNKKDFPTSRSFAKKAISAKPNWGDPYMLIGSMYAQSAGKKEISDKDIENQYAYWAACDMFKKAAAVDAEIAVKASNSVKTYSVYFPNKEEAFFYGLQEGQEVTIGGWINVKTTARFKQ